MKARRVPVQLQNIRIPAGFDSKENSVIKDLAERFGESGIQAILIAYPPVVKVFSENEYELVSGEMQVRIARAILRPATKLTSLLISTTTEAKLFGAIEELIVPLMFRCASDDYSRRAKRCIDNGSAATLGRNFDTVDCWQRLYKLASGRKRRRPLTSE